VLRESVNVPAFRLTLLPSLSLFTSPPLCASASLRETPLPSRLSPFSLNTQHLTLNTPLPNSVFSALSVYSVLQSPLTRTRYNHRMPKMDSTPELNPAEPSKAPGRATRKSKKESGEVPIPTLERLTTYLRCLIDMGATGIDTVSSAQIEQQTHISAAQFRKDLSHFYESRGEFGKPGVGYNVADLESRIAEILQIHRLQPIILIGAGNLGSALVGYPGLKEHKFHIVAAFDNDPGKLGKRLLGMDILHVDRMREVNVSLGARLAILAVPAVAAQAAADIAVQSGIRAILNFAPIMLKLPEHIVVRNVSFLQELAVLSYHLTNDTRETNGKK
jgi:redox-sensing transcriptional repressor